MAGIGQRLDNFKHAARPSKTIPHSPHSPRQNPGNGEAVLESRSLWHELSIGSDECGFDELAVENGHAARSAFKSEVAAVPF